MLLWASVKGDGRLVPIDAIGDSAKPQAILSWDVAQIPVDAMVHRENLPVEVDNVEVLRIVPIQPRQLRWEFLELGELGIIGLGLVADLVYICLKGALLGRILGSHRPQPFYNRQF